MRQATIAFAALGFLFLVGGQARADYQTNESTVKDVCGKNLQTTKNGMGCTKCNTNTNSCQDYSCNKTSKGPGKGCRVTTIGPMDRKATKGGKDRAGQRAPQGDATVTGKPQRHVPSHVMGEATASGGKFDGKPIQGVSNGLDKQQPAGPVRGHGGGRATGNNRH